MCNTIIHGILVESDSSLSGEEINNLVYEVIQSWTWEGKKLGKIEIIRDGQWMQVRSYEQPFIQLVPMRATLKE